ncbi:MAG: YARHG domain-containing protein [Eubacterium sp.]|nr:YARHG domain-containing protein [Eubacterium sp.]
MKWCPNCGSFIPDDAQFCRECGAKQGPESWVVEEQEENVSEYERICPFCGGVIPSDAQFCRHCGRALADEGMEPSGRYDQEAYDYRDDPSPRPESDSLTGKTPRNNQKILLIALIAVLAAVVVLAVVVIHGKVGKKSSADQSGGNAAASISDSSSGSSGESISDSSSEPAADSSEAVQSEENAAAGSQEEAMPEEKADDEEQAQIEHFGSKIRLNAKYDANSGITDTENLNDTDLGTVWAFDSSTIGEVTITLDHVQRVYGVCIAPGCQAGKDYFLDFGMPESVLVESSGQAWQISFYGDESALSKQETYVVYYEFPEGPIMTDSVTVSMNSVRLGRVSESPTCVSELFLYTYAEDQTYAASQDPQFTRTIPAELNEWNQTEAKKDEKKDDEDDKKNESDTDQHADDVLPQSSTEYLKKSDLKSLSKDDLQLAINEIFARNGYIFKTEWLQEYFEKKSWYHGDSNDQSVIDKRFSKIEKANVDLIRSYQKEKGYM